MMLAVLPSFRAMAQEVSGPALGIDFSVKASMDLSAFSKEPDRFLKSLARALEMLDMSGHAVALGGQADITGQLGLNGMKAFDFHLTGSEKWMSLVSSLFGEKPVVITLPNYVPFLLKMYYYFDIPVQYIGVFTDPYSYLHGLKPAYEEWVKLTGGAGSRSFTPEQCIEMAGQLSESLTENDALSFWLKGLLQHVGLDETLSEFFYALPDWAAEITKNGGLDILVSETGETWTLGGETVFKLTRAEGEMSLELNLPDWEGYQLSGSARFTEAEGGLAAAVDVDLKEEGAEYAHLSLKGENLPDGKRMQGDGKVSLSLGGEGLGIEQSADMKLQWDQRNEGDKTLLNGQVSLLDPGTKKPAFTMSGQIGWGDTEESFTLRTKKDMKWIDLFCMNDNTFREFFADAKWPIIRSAIPFFVELPAGLIDGLIEWMDENGILTTLMSGLGE
jgi:hypothetical protein